MPPGVWRRSHAAKLAAFAVAEQPLLMPDLAFRDANAGERHLSSLARANGAPQFVGNLVRALPERDAGP